MNYYKWQIIEGVTLDGAATEYQVSDGTVGERSISYDFLTLGEAESCLVALVSGE